MFGYRMDHLFSYIGRLEPPELIGPGPDGIRATFYISGGEVAGPHLQGVLREGGADWFCLRRDGIGQPDVRCTIQTHDGALIDMTYVGFGDLGEDAYEKMLRGELPARQPLKSAPRFRTAHPAYQWLHREFCVSIGEFDRDALCARYDVYALR